MRLQRLPAVGSSNMQLQPVRPVSDKQLPQPPSMNAPKSNWDKFKSWLKDNRVISGSLASLSRLEILNKYKDYLMKGSKMAEAVGYGKKGKKSKMIKNPDELCKCIHQNGGSWSDFTSWIKNRANDVADVGRKVGSAFKTAGNYAYNKAIRPSFQYVKDHPLSSVGYLAKGLSYLPTPLSAPLSTAGTALGTAGTLLGRGQSGGARKSPTGKVLYVFND
jgi:hypothetical protein